MKDLPAWVVNSVGIYAVLGSVLFLVLIVVATVALKVLLDLASQVRQLTGQVRTLTDKVNGIAEQVSAVTTEVGARATGIVRLVDEHTSGAVRLLEIAAPALFVIGAFLRIRNSALKRGRRR
jgi:outer membrane murein-binding lipoprotein Lpp